MSDLTVYSFEDADGNEYTDWTTTDFFEARGYASDNECRLVENTYRWYDSETIEDYCQEEDEDDEDQISNEDIQAHIDAGVMALTEHFGDAATWANRVPIGGTDDRYLDIDNPSACVLHFVFKDEILTEDERSLYDNSRYCLGVKRLGLANMETCDLGFCASDNEGERLTDMWRETIFQLQTCN